MRSKKALEELRVVAISKWGLDRVNIINKDLDRLEELKIENDELKRINGAYLESNIVFQDLIKKLKKAIEILKTKIKMEPYHLHKSRYYYLYIGARIVLLSREEYELLKEVLENGL